MRAFYPAGYRAAYYVQQQTPTVDDRRSRAVMRDLSGKVGFVFLAKLDRIRIEKYRYDFGAL